jgi:hypothetical protein
MDDRLEEHRERLAEDEPDGRIVDLLHALQGTEQSLPGAALPADTPGAQDAVEGEDDMS